MRFLVDAQLPASVARLLRDAGHDAVHTSELADGNRTTDAELCRIADGDGRVVVSKDRDFRDSHLLRRSPRRLLVVATGNIANRDLLGLLAEHLPAIEAALVGAALVELRADVLVIHGEER